MTKEISLTRAGDDGLPDKLYILPLSACEDHKDTIRFTKKPKIVKNLTNLETRSQPQRLPAARTALRTTCKHE